MHADELQPQSFCVNENLCEIVFSFLFLFYSVNLPLKYAELCIGRPWGERMEAVLEGGG